MAQHWEHSPPTNVTRVQIPTSTLFVGWVCCWFSPLLREVSLRVLRFSSLLKNQNFQMCTSENILLPPPPPPYEGHFYFRPPPNLWNFHFRGCLSNPVYSLEFPWFSILVGSPLERMFPFKMMLHYPIMRNLIVSAIKWEKKSFFSCSYNHCPCRGPFLASNKGKPLSKNHGGDNLHNLHYTNNASYKELVTFKLNTEWTSTIFFFS